MIDGSNVHEPGTSKSREVYVKLRPEGGDNRTTEENMITIFFLLVTYVANRGRGNAQSMQKGIGRKTTVITKPKEKPNFTKSWSSPNPTTVIIGCKSRRDDAIN
ncbi:hypothetical protein KY284_001108 [Solanum tuberosum]|nr:hypothetical protein KY284_001108 [Solanum tuberosum]